MSSTTSMGGGGGIAVAPGGHRERRVGARVILGQSASPVHSLRCAASPADDSALFPFWKNLSRAAGSEAVCASVGLGNPPRQGFGLHAPLPGSLFS